MTIILTCMTPTYIIQASDRRLTLRGSGEVADDHANKAVAFNFETVFGYTGISQVKKGNVRIDRWIADTLKPDLTLEENLEHIRMQLDQDTHPKEPLAVVCACWATTIPGTKHSACISVISNFYDQDGNILTPTDKFRRVGLVVNPGVPIAFHEVGTPTTAAEGVDVRKELRRNINKLQKKYGNSPPPPSELAKLMVYSIRTLSSALIKKAVGKDIMVTSIPNRELPDLQRTPTTFEYFPEDRDEPISYSPILITRNAICYELTSRSLAEGEFERIKQSVRSPE